VCVCMHIKVSFASADSGAHMQVQKKDMHIHTHACMLAPAQVGDGQARRPQAQQDGRGNAAPHVRGVIWVVPGVSSWGSLLCAGLDTEGRLGR